MRFESEVDRIYRQAPRELGVEGKVRGGSCARVSHVGERAKWSALQGGRMAVEIQFGESADGAVQSEEACDVVLWNPWVRGGGADALGRSSRLCAGGSELRKGVGGAGMSGGAEARLTPLRWRVLGADAAPPAPRSGNGPGRVSWRSGG